MVAFDLSLVTTPDEMRAQVRQALEAAGELRAAEDWMWRSRTVPSTNGLVVLAREYVTIVPWPRPRRDGAP